MALVTDVTEIAQFCASSTYPGLCVHPLAPAGNSRVTPPAFLLGPAPDALLAALCSQTSTPEVACYTLHDALVAPTGIAIAGRVALHGDGLAQPAHHVIAVADRLNQRSRPLRRRRITAPLAVIYGPAHETWGHWLVDFLPRLWVLHAAGHDLTRLQYLVPPDLAGFAAKLLAACGIGPAQLVPYAYWSELIQADTLLLPTVLRHADRFAPSFAQARDWLVRRLRLALGVPRAAPSQALFVSRLGAPQLRRLAQREQIESQAQAAGLHVVHPQAMPLAAQLRLFAGASAVVGEYGSGLHNTLFARPGTPVCALRGIWRHPGFVQTGLGCVLGQPTAYVFGAGDGTEDNHDFMIRPDDFAAALALLTIPPARKRSLAKLSMPPPCLVSTPHSALAQAA